MKNTILRAISDPRIQELHASHAPSDQSEIASRAPRLAGESLSMFKNLLETEYRRLVFNQRITDESFHHSSDDLMDETDWCLSQRELDLRRKLRGREGCSSVL